MYPRYFYINLTCFYMYTLPYGITLDISLCYLLSDILLCSVCSCIVEKDLSAVGVGGEAVVVRDT